LTKHTFDSSVVGEIYSTDEGLFVVIVEVRGEGLKE